MKSRVAARKKLLSITEAAAVLGIHRITLSKLMRANAAPSSILFGKRRYFTLEIIDQWIRARSVS